MAESNVADVKAVIVKALILKALILKALILDGEGHADQRGGERLVARIRLTPESLVGTSLLSAGGGPGISSWCRRFFAM